ncbi:MAG: hypothetical protein QOG61_293 [Candidatus Binataceae bacterium]|nr:hypothetical protein [Candidatus Binataceae bacterium]MEA2679352.1 hypothetical protein [Candidatus Binataceae bacterium]
MSTENEIRDRLKSSLDKLTKLKATQLTREDTLGPQLCFRAGIPFFERTLAVYRQLANTDLSRVPSAYLEIAANHAEESVNLFDQIEAFDPHGIDRPEQLRNLLINDVRDAHPKLYEDLSVLLIPGRGHGERIARPSNPLGGFLLVALIAGAVIVGYHYSIYDGLIRELQDLVHGAMKSG